MKKKPTIEDLQREIQQLRKELQHTHKETQHPPKVPRIPYSSVMPQPLWQRLMTASEQLGLKKTEIINEAVDALLKEKGF